MPHPAPDFIAILRVLARHRVAFLVVGGVAAVAQGASITTYDLDVVHARDPANAERLHAALLELDATYREHLPKRLPPRLQDLALPGHHLLMTRHGPLDVLGTIGAGRGYGELVGRSRSIALEPSFDVLVLDLAEIIATKEETGREKDRAVLPILRRVLEERNRTS